MESTVPRSSRTEAIAERKSPARSAFDRTESPRRIASSIAARSECEQQRQEPLGRSLTRHLPPVPRRRPRAIGEGRREKRTRRIEIEPPGVTERKSGGA